MRWSHLEDDLTNARSQVNELHLACDRGNEVDHLVDQIETGFAVHFGCERLVVVKVVGITNGSVVHLDTLYIMVSGKL